MGLDPKFERKIAYEPMSGCWLWAGATSGGRYGKICRRVNGRAIYIQAHRYSYEAHCGPIPDGVCVLHKCDTPYCVNPDHLFLGSQIDNIKDRDTKGRSARDGNGRYSVAWR